ncbi:hypothetical protein EQH57_0031 [Dictyocoela roeselum]|nr:hypothetical protein EQH57_0031 [Dictyocoela roeselum]
MTTRAYIKQIEIITRKLATCFVWSEQITNLKKQENFSAGLVESTKIEITRYPNRTYTKSVETLINLETLLITQFHRIYNELNITPNKSEEQHHFERERYNRYNNDVNSNRHKNLTPSHAQRKYYRYHKLKTHIDSECRSKNKKYDNKNEEKTFTIKETPIMPRLSKLILKSAIRTTRLQLIPVRSKITFPNTWNIV